jgi:hypothetical protein
MTILATLHQKGGHPRHTAALIDADPQGSAARWPRQSPDGKQRGGSRGEGMALTGHKTSAVFDKYYQAGAVLNNPAARIFD